MKDWAKNFLRGAVSRREFVERAASGGLSLFATASLLSAKAHAEGRSVVSDHAHHHDHSGHGHPVHDQRQQRPAAAARRTWDQTNISPWEEWLKQENLPVYRDYHVADLRKASLKPWKRLGEGVSGAYIDLVGGEGVNVGYLCEVAPGARTEPQRYLFEEVLYVLTGEGESVVWNPGGRAKQSVRWKAGSVLAPPLNVWRQHINRGQTPARFLVMTNAPVVIDLFHNLDFVFNNDYAFRDRYDGEADFFGTGPEKIHHKNTRPEESEQARGVDTWDGGFVPDARQLALYESRERGSGNSRIELQLADNTMQAHISEFEVGTYKKAHRHGPGSHVVMLNGRGYTLMWKGSLKFSEAKNPLRIDWVEGSLFVPPDGWFHQHFNAGNEPARYLAPTWGGDGKWFMRSLGGGGRTHRLGKTSTRKGGNLIEYEDEDPAIREIYVAELKKNGVELRMPSKGEKGK
jgi:oxalate decarboxylase/phosphoglucose isomerase-like protein (cupin superfamily)